MDVYVCVFWERGRNRKKNIKKSRVKNGNKGTARARCVEHT
jgi:hypothetical protein